MVSRALLVVLVWCLAGVALAEPPDTAAEARAHFNARRYREAINAYERALEQTGDGRYAYNVGRIHELLREPGPAVLAYEDYLVRLPLADDRTEVEERIRSLREELGRTHREVVIAATPSDASIHLVGHPREYTGRAHAWLLLGRHRLRVTRDGYAPLEETLELTAGPPLHLSPALVERRPVGFIVVESDVPGAQAFVDGKAVGPVPTEPIEVAVGEHLVRVDAAGYQGFSQRVTVKEGLTLVVRAELAPQARIEPPSPWRQWTLIGVAAVVAGVGAGLHVGAVLDRDEADALSALKVTSNPDDLTHYQDLDESYRLKEALAWTMYGLSTAALVGAIVLFALPPDGSDVDLADDTPTLTILPSPLGGQAILRF